MIVITNLSSPHTFPVVVVRHHFVHTKYFRGSVQQEKFHMPTAPFSAAWRILQPYSSRA